MMRNFLGCVLAAMLLVATLYVAGFSMISTGIEGFGPPTFNLLWGTVACLSFAAFVILLFVVGWWIPRWEDVEDADLADAAKNLAELNNNNCKDAEVFTRLIQEAALADEQRKNIVIVSSAPRDSNNSQQI